MLVTSLLLIDWNKLEVCGGRLDFSERSGATTVKIQEEFVVTEHHIDYKLCTSVLCYALLAKQTLIFFA